MEADLEDLTVKLNICRDLIKIGDNEGEESKNEGTKIHRRTLKILGRGIKKFERKLIPIRDEVSQHTNWLTNPNKEEPLSNAFGSLKILQDKVLEFGEIDPEPSAENKNKAFERAQEALNDIYKNLKELQFEEI